MPRHLATDANVLRGTVSFFNSRNGQIQFKKENGTPVTFTKQPFVSLTILNQTDNPVFRLNWLRGAGGSYTGCNIRFSANYTGDVDWEVKE